MASRFFSVVSHNARIFLPMYPIPLTEAYTVYCIPLHRNFFCTVSHTGEQLFLHNKYNTEELWDAMQNNLLYFIPQCHRFCSVVSYNERDFPLLWDTTQEVFSCCGIQGKRFSSIVGYNGRVFSFVGFNGRGFFPLWDTMEKNDTTKNNYFKILSASHCLQTKF
jgi:hypothetical protein